MHCVLQLPDAFQLVGDRAGSPGVPPNGGAPWEVHQQDRGLPRCQGAPPQIGDVQVVVLFEVSLNRARPFA